MLDLPNEIIHNCPLITIIGNKELIIENHKNILEYTEQRIKIKTNCGILEIDGQKLNLKEITSENISIKGNLIKLEYLL